MQRLSRLLARFGILLMLVPLLIIAPQAAQARAPFCIPPGDFFLAFFVVFPQPCPAPQAPAKVTGIDISGPSQVTAGAQVRFAITTTTDTGEFLLPTPAWTTTGGTLALAGPWVDWTVPTQAGAYTLGASYGSFTASKKVTVVAGPATTVALSPAGPVTVEAGKNLTFSVTATDTYGNPVDAVWSVTGVGSVKDGAFSAQQAGKATVTLKAGDKSASVQVTVVAGPAAKVTLTPAGVSTTETGAPLQFAAAAVDAYGNPVDAPAEWTHTGVGSVSDGRFRASRPGTATVTAQVGSASATSDTITVGAGLAPAGTADAGGAPVRIDITPTPAGAFVMAGPVLVEGNGKVSISFPVGEAGGSSLLVHYYDARLQAWIAVPTIVAAGHAAALVPAGVPVALMWAPSATPTR